MLTTFRYILDKSSKKFRCPACNKKRLVRYTDDETGNYLPNDIGRCDRELNCGYHLPPREADGIELGNALYRVPEPPPEPVPSYLPFEYVERSQGNYKANTLISWLATLPGWDQERAEAVARRYHVGTSKNGWAIFWQIDESAKVRSGKLMKYDTTGHRVKDGYSQDWIHAKLKRSGHLDKFELVQCFFGLHLLDEKPVAIVESEKTAIIASEYLPQFTWIAAGQLNGISEYKMQPLKGRKVALFPDIGAFDKWNEKALELSSDAEFKVSDLLERKAPEQHKGYDIADYLIQFDLKTFKSGKSDESGGSRKHIFFNDAEAPNGFNPWTGEIFDSRGYPRSWDDISIN